MEKTQIAAIGGGPAGIAVAVEAKFVGIDSVIILEKAEQSCGTIVNLYHEGKHLVADKGSILAAFNSANKAMEGIRPLLDKKESVN